MSLADLISGTGEEATRESDGFLQGLAIGVVTDNQDSEGLGRVRVRLPHQRALKQCVERRRYGWLIHGVTSLAAGPFDHQVSGR